MGNLEIDMSDPGVRQLLGRPDPGPATGKSERELVHIAGDMDTGVTQTWQMDRGKHEVFVVYRDTVLTVDVYSMPGEPLKVHLLCPRCSRPGKNGAHMLQITGERKAISFDPRAAVPPQVVRAAMDLPGRPKGPFVGLLSVEPFQCTWELPEAGEHHAGALAGTANLCKWKVAIDNNVAKDA